MSKLSFISCLALGARGPTSILRPHRKSRRDKVVFLIGSEGGVAEDAQQYYVRDWVKEVL